jgi:hypothetical protein
MGRKGFGRIDGRERGSLSDGAAEGSAGTRLSKESAELLGDLGSFDELWRV